MTLRWPAWVKRYETSFNFHAGYIMEPTVIIMVLLSALLHALRNFFNKKALDKQAFIWWFEIFGLLFFSPSLYLFPPQRKLQHFHWVPFAVRCRAFDLLVFSFYGIGKRWSFFDLPDYEIFSCTGFVILDYDSQRKRQYARCVWNTTRGSGCVYHQYAQYWFSWTG